VLAAGLTAACGTGGVVPNTNATNGKQLFVSKCGGCHTLSDAGTTGTVGPNLDDAFAYDRRQGFSESTVRQVVRDQIHFPSPASGNSNFPVMPPDLVTGTDADEVSAYVASVAGVPASATTSSATPASPPPPPPPPPTSTSQPTTSSSSGDPESGKSLYSSLGCSGCHSLDGSKGTGPTFKGLYGSQVKLTTGKTVTADPAYLTQSIEDPDAEIVQGYQPGVMTSVIKPHQVSASDANDLVAYLKTLK
jgi:mono/diheme cytochrome c family protein